MTIEYEKKIHQNLWDLMAQEKFKWFRIDETRNDREDLIAAIKTFIDAWGCAEFRDTTYSSFRVFYRYDKVKHEIEDINRRICVFNNTGDTFSVNTSIDAKKELSSLTEPKKHLNAYWDFYTKAYDPERLKKQLEKDARLAANARPIPGVPVINDDDEF